MKIFLILFIFEYLCLFVKRRAAKLCFIVSETMTINFYSILFYSILFYYIFKLQPALAPAQIILHCRKGGILVPEVEDPCYQAIQHDGKE